MAAHAHLKNMFMEDVKRHNLMRWLNYDYLTVKRWIVQVIVQLRLTFLFEYCSCTRIDAHCNTLLQKKKLYCISFVFSFTQDKKKVEREQISIKCRDTEEIIA